MYAYVFLMPADLYVITVRAHTRSWAFTLDPIFMIMCALQRNFYALTPLVHLELE